MQTSPGAQRHNTSIHLLKRIVPLPCESGGFALPKCYAVLSVFFVDKSDDLRRSARLPTELPKQKEPGEVTRWLAEIHFRRPQKMSPSVCTKRPWPSAWSSTRVTLTDAGKRLRRTSTTHDRATLATRRQIRIYRCRRTETATPRCA